jgi:hypothetical protein
MIPPDYTKSFVGIPLQILNTFSSSLTEDEKGYLINFPIFPSSSKQIVAILLDAFGWRFIEYFLKQRKIKSFEKFYQRSQLNKLYSQFPSTTAAHVTTFASGLPVGMHGIYEWNIYLPEADRVVIPLPYLVSGENLPQGLLSLGVKPESFLPQNTIYRRLLSSDVKSYTYLPEEYMLSPYNQVMSSAAEVKTYHAIKKGIASLAEGVIKSDQKGEKALHQLYYGGFDLALHFEGVENEKSNLVAERFFNELEREFFNVLSNKVDQVSVVLFADHGMTTTNPHQTSYLDLELPEIIPHLKKNKNGARLAPAGSSRDLFLHIDSEAIDAVIEMISLHLVGKALVKKTSQLVDQGYFGNQISPRFLSHLAEVIVLPEDGQLVYLAGEKKEFLQHFLGHHGGLTANENEIPLFVTQI